MQRIDDNTIELTHREVVAKEFHNELLDLGLSVVAATEAVEKFGRRTTRYDADFLLYLNHEVPLTYKT